MKMKSCIFHTWCLTHRCVMGATMTWRLLHLFLLQGLHHSGLISYYLCNDNKITAAAAPLCSSLNVLFLMYSPHLPYMFSHMFLSSPTVSLPLFLPLTFQLALCYLVHHPCVVLLFCWPLIDVQTCVRRACIQHNPILRGKTTSQELTRITLCFPILSLQQKETKTRVFKNMRRHIF